MRADKLIDFSFGSYRTKRHCIVTYFLSSKRHFTSKFSITSHCCFCRSVFFFCSIVLNVAKQKLTNLFLWQCENRATDFLCADTKCITRLNRLHNPRQLGAEQTRGARVGARQAKRGIN